MLIYAIMILGIPVGLFLVVGGIVRRIRVWRNVRTKQDVGRRCVCGYPVEHIEVPRCPECGTMIGFPKGVRAEDLGLSEAELQEAAARRRHGEKTR